MIMIMNYIRRYKYNLNYGYMVNLDVYNRITSMYRIDVAWYDW